jgi:hypothetical protein
LKADEQAEQNPAHNIAVCAYSVTGTMPSASTVESIFLGLLLSGVFLARSRQEAERGSVFGDVVSRSGALLVLIALIAKSVASKSWMAAVIATTTICLEIALMVHWRKSQ